MSKLTKALTAAAGNAGGDNLYVEDVFSTYLYEGTGATLAIVNGIDLDGEGGLVWVKQRDGTRTNHVFNTEVGLTGTGSRLRTDNTTVAANTSSFLTSFNANGFTVGDDSSVNVAYTSTYGGNYASWTFRKAEKFFDVVTWTGNNVQGRVINHNLGSTPGLIIVKNTAQTTDWVVHHRSLGFTKVLYLNQTAAAETTTRIMGATSTTFTVSDASALNSSSGTYVAYVFAHDAGGFGDDESIIKCGSYTGNGSTTGPIINLGFEPQWVMIKNITFANDWWIFDSMRGITSEGADSSLRANISGAENTGTNALKVTATGFQLENGGGDYNGSTQQYIYIAIRRPMKTPESGTEVFAAAFGNDSGSSPPTFSSGFTPDAVVGMWDPSSWNGSQWFSRLTGNKRLISSGAAVEGTVTEAQWDYMDGAFDWSNLTSYFAWIFKRATGFFDVVTYTGNNTYGRTVTHGLGVVPEMIIVKARNKAEGWPVYHAGIAADAETDAIFLQGDAPFGDNANYWADTKPTATNFTLGQDGSVNDNSTYYYIAYLFATLDGVSKVGSYTGTGSNVDVDCGFSAGARFVMIKRADSTGDWYTWDSTRGIVAGNDPYLLMNSAAAQVTSTDYIDPLSSGFTVTSSAPAALNASGGNYIFLAIA